jgi:hypothetical protein
MQLKNVRRFDGNVDRERRAFPNLSSPRCTHNDRWGMTPTILGKLLATARQLRRISFHSARKSETAPTQTGKALCGLVLASPLVPARSTLNLRTSRISTNFAPFRFVSAGLQSFGEAELWQAYREAFKEFARRVKELESLKTTGNVDRTSVDRALLELEMARVHYRQFRDTLASLLLSRRSSGFAESNGPRVHWMTARRYERLLSCCGNLKARREGFADDDWYRAEEIVRSARAADGHPASRASLS